MKIKESINKQPQANRKKKVKKMLFGFQLEMLKYMAITVLFDEMIINKTSGLLTYQIKLPLFIECLCTALIHVIVALLF